MPRSKSEKKKKHAEEMKRRDPYEVLGVSITSTDQQIKTAYRKLALKYHPDKNANDPKAAADMFKEITYSYNILSDPEKRKHYDTAGFQTQDDNLDLELDLSSLGAMTTMFAALFSKLGVPIKTLVSASVLEEAINGSVVTYPLALGNPVSRKVEKQCAHFYSVRITHKEAKAGIVCRVQSPQKSNFKLLYFDRDQQNAGLNLALQEDSVKKGKVTTAGMYFLGFPVFKLDPQSSILDKKDPDTAFFKKLQGFQPCEITELKAGVHTFAVYGDNFFKSATYTIEVLSTASFVKEKENLRAVEAHLSTKRTQISKFENEYRQVIAQFTDMTSRYMQEKQTIDELLKRRNEIQASYTTAPQINNSTSKRRVVILKEDKKKDKWYNIHAKQRWTRKRL
ncbi:hypothetical protein QVD17_29529 [Tagetes erecta]|uniref:J domain-containing protein n=1 Tax=Tagetes erecta TaxID=13708 RepID=A0AAD8KBU7_TARER|nr:hypothetical protein QVD17_29529 [Tagetes erecta]